MKIIKRFGKYFIRQYLINKISKYKGNIAIIIMYHNVRYDGKNTSIIPEAFEDGLLMLIENSFKCRSLGNLIKGTSNSREFIITFDDSEKGILNYGVPILKKYNLTATLFISPSLIGKTYGFSWRKIPKSIITLQEIRKYNGYKIEHMDKNDIKKWIDNGFEIGSHGLRHIDLSSISLYPHLLKEEILGSKEILEREFDAEIKSFCYPFGSFNNRVKEEVAKYYKCALTVESGGILNSKDIPLYELPRISAGNSFKFSLDIYKILNTNSTMKK